MKSLLLLSLTAILVSCATTSTTTNKETLSLEQIAERSQSTERILDREEDYVPALLNNTSRNTTKEMSAQLNTTETKKTRK